jgi:poly(3-hydroxybutyrate) depolymerase
MLMAEHVIDADHVYLAGAWTGGLMAWSMACAVLEADAVAAPDYRNDRCARRSKAIQPDLCTLVVISETGERMQDL